MGQIGQKLQEARHAQKLTFEDLQQLTKIRIRYLQALESEQWEVFPGEVYLKGFLKSYAQALGLNSQELLQWYQASTSAEAAEIAPQPLRTEPSQPPTEAPQPIRTPSYRPSPLANHYQPVRSSTTPPWGYWVAACGLVVVLACSWLGFSAYQASRQRQAQDGGNPASSSPATMPTPTPSPGPTASPSATVVPPAPTVELVKINETAFEVRYEVKGVQKLEVKSRVKPAPVGEADYKCWMEAQSDGQNVGYAMMTSGKGETFSGSETIKIRLGNPQVVEITVNGVNVPPAATVEPIDFVFIKQP